LSALHETRDDGVEHVLELSGFDEGCEHPDDQSGNQKD
jgi:hypothetical protein